MSEQQPMGTGVRPVVLAAGDDALVHLRTVSDDPAVEPYVSLAIAPTRDPRDVLGALILTPGQAAGLLGVLATHLAAHHPDVLAEHVEGFTYIARNHEGDAEMAHDSDPSAVWTQAADVIEQVELEEGDPTVPAHIAGYVPVALVPVRKP